MSKCKYQINYNKTTYYKYLESNVYYFTNIQFRGLYIYIYILGNTILEYSLIYMYTITFKYFLISY